MSLATSSGAAGGMGGGGAALSAAAMAHGGPTAMQVHQQAHAHAGGQHAHAHHGAPTLPPGTLAALAADVVDKGQNLTLRGVRGVAGLPLVGVDLYGETCEASAFPPLPDEEEEEETKKGRPSSRSVRSLGNAGPSGSTLLLRRDDDAAHKAVRRLLTKGRGYDAVLKNALADTASGSKSKDVDELIKSGKVAAVVRPHLLLGSRRTSQLHPSTLSNYSVAEPEPAAIAEDGGRGEPVTIRDGTLDGGSVPQDDDFDRVAFHLSVHSGKKVIGMLPEEAVGIVLARAKRSAYKEFADEIDAKDEDADDEEMYLEVPTAVAVPGWACGDATSEALVEANSSGGGPTDVVLYQRSVAAAVGSLLPRPGGAPNKFLALIGERINAVNKERQKKAMAAAARRGGDDDDDDVPRGEYCPLLVYAGITPDGLEMAAVQLSKVQDMEEVDGLAPFGDVKVVTSIAVRSADPMSEVRKAVDTLTRNVDEVLPELFEHDHGPVAFVTYGTIPSQLKLKEALTKALAGIGDPDWGSGTVKFQSTHEDCVASGTALLGAISHGRVRTVTTEERKDGKARHRARPAVHVQNSSCVAVGVRYDYFGGGGDDGDRKEKGKGADGWSDVRTVFDFDRRVPAGPYQIEMSAAECAAIRAGGGAGGDMDEEALLEAAKKFGGSKNIAAREEAALALRVQVVQRSERDGDWVPVGDPMKPLTFVKGSDDGDDDGDGGGEGKEEKEAVACESAVLELSLNPVGLITSSLVSDGQSVVQATKSARNSALRYYLGIAAAVLFFGGFMVKSYVEEKVFERDTQRVLAYYKHAAPNSFNDGDERNARYLVWKYKGKKDKLWRRLEAKYGVPVKQAWEWDDDADAEGKDGEEEGEEQNLDETEGGGKPDDGGEGKEEQEL